MEYQEFTDYIGTLDFVRSEARADAMIKAVLGILCSLVDENLAHLLCDRLPDPLNAETLRRHQVRKDQPSFPEYIQEIRTQFGINSDQAFEVVDSVLRITHDAVGEYVWSRFTSALPADLSQAIRKP